MSDAEPPSLGTSRPAVTVSTAAPLARGVTAPSTAPSGEMRAVAAALLGSTLVGSVPMFAIGLYQQGLQAADLLFWRYWIAMTLLAPLAIFTSPSLRDDWTRAGRGLFVNAITLGAIQTFTYFKAVESLPTSVVITLFFTYPILTLAIDRFVFEKSIGLGSVLAVAMVFLGALLTGWPSLSFAGGNAVGVACAVATPVVYAIYIAIAYRFTRQASPFAGAAAIYFGLACTYTVVAMIVGLKAPTDLAGWASLLFIGIFGGVVQISSFAYALPRLSASGYSIVVSMELVTVVLLGVLVLGEHLSLVQVGGVLLVVVGIVADRLLRQRAAS